MAAKIRATLRSSTSRRLYVKRNANGLGEIQAEKRVKDATAPAKKTPSRSRTPG